MPVGGQGLAGSPAPPLGWLRLRNLVSEELFGKAGLLRSLAGAAAMDELPFGEAAVEQALDELGELDAALLTDIQGAWPGAPARPVRGRMSWEVTWPGASARACVLRSCAPRIEG